MKCKAVALFVLQDTQNYWSQEQLCCTQIKQSLLHLTQSILLIRCTLRTAFTLKCIYCAAYYLSEHSFRYKCKTYIHNVI